MFAILFIPFTNKSSEYFILFNFFVLFLGTLTENSDHVNISPTLLLISLIMFALGMICLIVFMTLSPFLHKSYN